MKKIIIVGLLLGCFRILTAQVADVEKKIDIIISQMTLDEKVKMCHAQSKFTSQGVERLGIPELMMSDGPHGVRAEIEWDSWKYAGWTSDSCTAFPALTCLASTFNPELAHKYGVAIGEEARYREKDILLGPGVNIYRTPLNGRNFEYMGEDPFLASTMVVPYIKGVQSNGVAACVKHYVLNNQEKWRDHINVEVSDRALREIYLPAFKAAVQEGGVWSVMGSYNKYREQWCCHNEVLVNDILKGEWSFDGVYLTDWGAAHDTREAAFNGLDIEMGTGTDGLVSSTANAYDNYHLAFPFLKLLKNGEIDKSVLDDKVRRILRLQFRTNLDRSRPYGNKLTKEHFDIARKVAQEGIVLLKNTKNFLPLAPETTQTIAVIGENATKMMTIGGGSSELKTAYEISPLQGIKERFKEATILHSMGYASGPSHYGRVIPSVLNQDSLFTAAIATARKADIVIYVGGLNKNHEQDCENSDRKSLNLPFGQDVLLDELFKVNKNVAIVLVSGNAIAMPWLDKPKAIVQAWYLGSEAGRAISDVLCGYVNPSGKLPFTFPVKLEDNGAHAFDEMSYPGNGVDQIYKEDILVGYRWYDTKGIEPLYPFGYGLSYTTFKMTDAKVDKDVCAADEKIKVSVKVSNTGKVAGAEVVQVYMHDVEASVLRPQKELKAFRKVFLEAGESNIVDLDIDVAKFAYYDDVKQEWHLEEGDFHLMVGNSSQNIVETLDLKVK
jgi:beta-glucosidase